MRILLIQPKDIVGNYTPKRPLMAQAYLGAALEKAGHIVKILDMRLDGLEKEFEPTLNLFNPDVVCFSLASLTVKNAFIQMDLVKKHNPDAIIVAGGPEVTTLAESILPKSYVDFIIVGEGEYVFPEFLEKYQKNQDWKSVPGLGYKENDRMIINERQLRDDLDSIPFPAWHLSDLEKYNKNIKRIKFPVMTARGCPHECIFCTIPAVYVKYRYRSPKNVVDELEYIHNKYGTTNFQILDDNFAYVNKRAIGICDEIITRGLNKKIKWTIGQGLTAASVTKELAFKMKEAGCTLVSIGIESIHEDVLRKMKKPANLYVIEKAIKILKEAGIKIKAFFIVGLPGSTYDKEVDSVAFFKRYNIDIPRYSNPVPMPQTELYDWAKENSIPVIPIEQSHYEATHTLGTQLAGKEYIDANIVYETKDFSKEERLKAYLYCTSEADKWVLQNMFGKPLGYIAWKLSKIRLLRHYGEKVLDRMDIF